MEKYKIELTKEQLHIVMNCVEKVSRFNAGQLEHIIEDINWYTDNVTNNRKEIEHNLFILKRNLFPELSNNESYGVGKCDNKLGLLRQKQYEIYRELRYQLEVLNPVNDWNVYKSPSLKYTDESFPLVKLSTND